MATPSELSLEAIRQYLLDNGGTVQNRELVKHFKRFLTDPETRVEARNNFKEYVNVLASIKNEEGEKFLVLKKQYRQGAEDVSSPIHVSTPTSPLRDPPPYRPPPPAPLSPTSDFSSTPSSPAPRIPAFDPPADWQSPEVHEAEIDRVEEPINDSVQSPPVPPRRKSQDKLRLDNKENIAFDRNRNGQEAVIKEDEASTNQTPTNVTSAELLSVRERMQRFNRMATETDLHGKANGTSTPTKKRSEKTAKTARMPSRLHPAAGPAAPRAAARSMEDRERSRVGASPTGLEPRVPGTLHGVGEREDAPTSSDVTEPVSPEIRAPGRHFLPRISGGWT